MFDPTIFPNAISGLPSRLALTLTTSSGALVANATSVRPMTRGETPALRATVTPPLISNSAP